MSLPPGQVSPLAPALGDRSASKESASPSPEKRAVGRKSNARPRLPPPPADSALAYRINDAAIVSGLSRATLYRLIKENKLRSVRAAGRRLIPSDALRELLNGTA